MSVPKPGFKSESMNPQSVIVGSSKRENEEQGEEIPPMKELMKTWTNMIVSTEFNTG